MTLTKHTRIDLNDWHLLARGGILPKEVNGKYHLPHNNELLDNSLLFERNKNNWLPIHLSKNKTVAEFLYQLMITSYGQLNENQLLEDEFQLKNLITLGLLNNAESSQTKYGYDLEQFFVEQGYSLIESKKAAIKPSTQQRIDLAYFWLDLYMQFKIKYGDNNLMLLSPVYTSLANSNSYFFMALIKILMHSSAYIIKLEIEDYLKEYKKTIGMQYYISDRAFQLQQIIEQKFSVSIEIIKDKHNLSNEKTEDYLKNLEGF